MFIIWGKKIVRSKLGRRADFCLLCRDFRPIRVEAVQSVGHLNYIPLGRRQTLGFEQTCESCGLIGSVTQENDGPTIVHDRLADVETLISETNPDARRDWSTRLAFEDRIRANGLTADERLSALLESFVLADTLLERRTSVMHVDWVSGLSLLATFAVPVALLILGDLFFHTDRITVGQTALGVGGALALVTLIFFVTDGRRYARRAVLPILIRAIRPLRPTDEEIATVLEMLRARNDKLGKYLKPQQVVDALMFATD